MWKCRHHLLLLVLASMLSGCGLLSIGGTITERSVRTDEKVDNISYIGTRAGLECIFSDWGWNSAGHPGPGCVIDLPLSIVFDTIFIPYTVPKTIYNMNHREKPAGSEFTDGTVSVFLIPLDDFPVNYVAQVARELSQDLGLHVKPTIVMGTRELRPFPATDQYCVEDIVESAIPIVERLPEKQKDTIFIIISARDINERARNFRFLFAWHQKEKRISVISTARLLAGDNNSRANDKKIFDRVYKMTKRAIGEQYYGLKRSADIRDIMYSPIMNLDDVDRIGMEYLELKK